MPSPSIHHSSWDREDGDDDDVMPSPEDGDDDNANSDPSAAVAVVVGVGGGKSREEAIDELLSRGAKNATSRDPRGAGVVVVVGRARSASADARARSPPPPPVFAPCRFLLVGFSDDPLPPAAAVVTVPPRRFAARDRDGDRDRGTVEGSGGGFEPGRSTPVCCLGHGGGNGTDGPAAARLATTGAKLRLLIRRGRGTVDWDLTDRTTHVVVSDRCGAGLRAEALSAAGGRSRGGGGSARAVSIGWVLESYGTGTTADEADHPPAERGREEDERGYDGGRRAAGGASSLSGARRRSGTTTAADDSRSDRGRYGTSSSTPPPPPHPSGRDDDDGAVANANAVAKEEVIAAAVAPKRGRGVGSGTAFATASTPPPRRPNPPLRSRIFRGAAFVVSRLGPPPESTGMCADFGPRSDLEAMISDHGGHVLSRRIVDALLKDAAVKKHDGDDDDDDDDDGGTDMLRRQLVRYRIGQSHEPKSAPERAEGEGSVLGLVGNAGLGTNLLPGGEGVRSRPLPPTIPSLSLARSGSGAPYPPLGRQAGGAGGGGSAANDAPKDHSHRHPRTGANRNGSAPEGHGSSLHREHEEESHSPDMRR